MSFLLDSVQGKHQTVQIQEKHRNNNEAFIAQFVNVTQ